MIENAFFLFKNKEMKKAQLVKSLNNLPQGLDKLEHGMTFQVKKTSANKIDFDVIAGPAFQK